MYRSRQNTARIAHRLASGLVIWVLCLLALMGGDLVKSALAGELPRTASLMPAVQQALSWASDKPVKHSVLLESSADAVTIKDLLKTHRQRIEIIRQQQIDARSQFERSSTAQQVLTLLPYSTNRFLSFIKLMQHYAAIASLQSKLMMSGTQQLDLMAVQV